MGPDESASGKPSLDSAGPSGALVVVAASAADAGWRDRVVAHVDLLATQHGYRVWDDRHIEAGDDRLAAVARAIEQARVVIALISSDYLAEGRPGVAPLEVDLARRYGRAVVPVIVRPCAWPRVDWLERAEVRPVDGRALSALSDSAMETALSDLAEEIDDRLRGAPRALTAVAPPMRRRLSLIGGAMTLMLGGALAGVAWLWRAPREIPEPIPCPRPVGGLYEAEAAQQSGSAALDTEHRGYSGAGFVSGYGVSAPGTSTTLVVDVPTDGGYALDLCYANATGVTRSLSLQVNGQASRRILLPPAARWDVWRLSSESVTLHAGKNTIAYRKEPGDSGAVNLDFVVVRARTSD